MQIETQLLITSIWKFTFSCSTWSFLSNNTSSASIYSAYTQNGPLVYILYGRTQELYFNSIEILDLSQDFPERQVVTDNWYTPNKRINHCSAVYNDKMLIFGGVTDKGVYLNDLWSFDMSVNLWTNIEASGDVPAPRALMSCINVDGLRLLVFGGKDSSKAYDDLYYLTISLSTWKIQPTSDNYPEPRYSACIVQIDYSFFIIGGRNNKVVFDEIWTYVDGVYDYYKINSNDKVSIEISDLECWAYEGSVYAVGGQTLTLKPSNFIYKIELSHDSKGVTTSNTSVAYRSTNVLPSQSSLIVTDKEIYMIFGSTWEYLTYPYIWTIDISFTKESLISVPDFLSIYGHSAVHYQDSLYIFGGGYSLDNVLLASTASNTLFTISLSTEDGGALECSIGTTSPDCTPCPPGTYYSLNQCLPCPAGRYSSTVSSISSLQCLPCMYGYHNIKSGASYCLKCSDSSFCPIGSIVPQQQMQKMHYQSIQPLAYDDNLKYIANTSTQISYAALAGSGILLISFLFSNGARAQMKKLDIFISQHNQKLDVPIVLKKTKIGGVFSLIFLLTAGVTVVGSLLNYSLGNITEIKSLVPVLILDTEISADFLQVNIVFYFYGGQCASDSGCVNENSITESGLNFSSKRIECLSKDYQCNILITYSGVSSGSSSSIMIFMGESEAYATSMSINLTSSSSVPNQISSVFLPIYTGSNLQLFRGITPTVISYELTPSVRTIQVFQSQSPRWNSDTGYHVMADQEVSVGSLSTQEE